MGKPTKILNQIGEFRRIRGDMTQQELAERVGVTRQTINAIEGGKYSPSLEAAFQIARALDAEIGELFQFPEDD